MTVRARGVGFQADFTHGDKRYRAQFPTQQAALTWEADTRAALIAGRPLPKAPTAGSATTATLGDWARRTVRDVWRGTKNEAQAARNVDIAVDYFGSNTVLSDITSLRIADFAAYLSGLGQSGATVNRKLAALSKVLSFAKSLDALDKMPTISRRPEGEPRERYLREYEVEALVNTLRHWGKPEEAALVAFLVDTGARLGEALRVRVMDVAADRVTLGALGSKNKEWRVIPLTQRLKTLLPEYTLGRRPEEPLFGVNRSTFQVLFKRLTEHLKLDGVVIHTLRHTTATWLAQRGVDIRQVQKWMGHKSIQVTLRYAKHSPVELFAAVDVLDRPPANVNAPPDKALA